jgi:hypothetical protein
MLPFSGFAMAITIRNKTTEELIRAIGRRTGEGPSAVIRRLAAAEASGQNEKKVPEAEVKRRLAVFEELRKRYPPPDPKPTWEEVQKEIDSLYGYLDEDPRSQWHGKRP